MMIRGLIVALTVAFVSAHARGDGKTMPAKRFLAQMRAPKTAPCWFKMKGKIQFKAKGMPYYKPTIEVRGRLSTDKWTLQLIVNANERWDVVRDFKKRTVVATQKVKPVPGELGLTDYHIRPEDVVLSFLDWPLSKELKPERGKRVFRLQNPKAKETVVIVASVDRFVPIKTRWFPNGALKHHKEFQLTDFSKLRLQSDSEEKIPIPSGLKIKGRGWVTLLTFDKPKGDIIDDKHPVPKDLFLK